jgi:uncharacterized protein (DUF1778 family)
MSRKPSKHKKRKTALLIYCTAEEADQIRFAAKQERRTITGFVMNAVATRLAIRYRLPSHLIKSA